MTTAAMTAPSVDFLELGREHALELLRTMVRLRRFEEKCAELYGAGKIRGFLHLYIGEEAIAAGVMPLLAPGDAVVSTYREHGHAIARGVPMTTLMAEMFGKVEGCCRGRGGSMHLFDVARRFYGGNAIVGGGIPVAAGLALADAMRARGAAPPIDGGGEAAGADLPVTACFFGDGAVAEGEFHETMNLASLWALPVLFLCENNQYAMGTALPRHQAQTELWRKADGYAMAAERVDGMDVLAVEAATRRALAAVRAGKGPFFLELVTYRFRAHSAYDPELYRPKEEVRAWRKRDPITLFQSLGAARGVLGAADVASLEAEADAEIAAAVAFADAGSLEPNAELGRFVLAPDSPGHAGGNGGNGGNGRSASAGAATVTSTYREAVRAGLREALREDGRVFLLGEDVGRYGGTYACSLGLLDELGPERVRDTPLSESAFVGMAIGAAIQGLRPIVEIMTVNFSLLALDQILNNAATLRHMSGGQIGVPLVIRMATGAGRQVAAQHSHSLEGWYAHIPGLKVLAPAVVEDARGMLWSALQDPDPVVIFEHAALYGTEGPLPEGAGAVDIDRAAVRRVGGDVTVIAYGGTVAKALEAARVLAERGVEVEVVDLRTLRPLDDATILASVRKTRRVVVVDEGWRTGSLAAEIITRIAEQAFYDLDAPLVRVCSEEVPIPYAKHLEEAALPQPARIVDAVLGLVGSGRG